MSRARNIKPSFFENEALAELPLECRLLFIGLWGLADREGRFEDRPKRIKAKIFPYDDFDGEKMLSQLAQSDGEFILRYKVDGKRYIQIINFAKHQNPHRREADSVIPPPNQAEAQPESNQGQAEEQTEPCPEQAKEQAAHDLEQAKALPEPNKGTAKDMPRTCLGHAKPRPRQERAGLNPESPFLNPESLKLYCTEPEKSASMPQAIPLEPEKPPDEKPVYSLILNDGSAHGVTQAEYDRYCELYPAVDAIQELRKMAGWLEANPTKRKTRRGIRRFINNWLSKAQDRGWDIRGAPQAPPTQYRFFESG